jgi:hypothetical protein
MAGHSRRSFLRGAGVTAAVATASVIVPSAAMAATGHPSKTEDDRAQGDAITGTVVAYVKDSKTGEISVMSGDREVVIKDRKLAQRLARIAD